MICRINLSNMDLFHKQIKKIYTENGVRLYELEASAGNKHVFIWSDSLNRYKIM